MKVFIQMVEEAMSKNRTHNTLLILSCVLMILSLMGTLGSCAVACQGDVNVREGNRAYRKHRCDRKCAPFVSAKSIPCTCDITRTTPEGVEHITLLNGEHGGIPCSPIHPSGVSGAQ